MELLKVVMLVGGFVYVTMALSIEGAKKGMVYYKSIVKEYTSSCL